MWLTVIAIALVQGSISVAWIIYRLYLPQLLVQWGLTEQLAAILIIIETFLGIIVEPLFGSLSDRQQRWLGSRFPLISLGVILASALFIALPSLVIFGQASDLTRWLFPSLAMAWALAMTMFRTPVISLLGISAPLNQLPLAASILTAITGIIGAFRPIVSNFILSLGSMWAFSLASIVMLIAVALLRQFQPVVNIEESEVSESKLSINLIPWSKLILIAAIALGMAWGIRLLMGTVTKAVNNPDYMIILGVLLAITALLVGILAVKIGNYKAMLGGTIGAILVLVLLNFTTHPLSLGLALIGFLIAFNLLSNGIIPLVIEGMPSNQTGLGIGVYFGSFGAAMSLFEIIFKQGTITPTINIILGGMAWLLVAICVQFSYKTSLFNR